MSTKTISIMDDVYKLLVRNRVHNESFSEIIRRHLKKKDVMDFAGALGDLDSTSAKKEIKKLRSDATGELLRNENP
jgi:predicted CopG family antitoxin